jgi:hypothetical protein
MQKKQVESCCSTQIQNLLTGLDIYGKLRKENYATGNLVSKDFKRKKGIYFKAKPILGIYDIKIKVRCYRHLQTMRKLPAILWSNI